MKIEFERSMSPNDVLAHWVQYPALWRYIIWETDIDFSKLLEIASVIWASVKTTKNVYAVAGVAAFELSSLFDEGFCIAWLAFNCKSYDHFHSLLKALALRIGREDVDDDLLRHVDGESFPRVPLRISTGLLKTQCSITVSTSNIVIRSNNAF